MTILSAFPQMHLALPCYTCPQRATSFSSSPSSICSFTRTILSFTDFIWRWSRAQSASRATDDSTGGRRRETSRTRRYHSPLASHTTTVRPVVVIRVAERRLRAYTQDKLFPRAVLRRFATPWDVHRPPMRLYAGLERVALHPSACLVTSSLFFLVWPAFDRILSGGGGGDRSDDLTFLRALPVFISISGDTPFCNTYCFIRYFQDTKIAHFANWTLL